MEQVDVILLMYFGDYFMATINYNFKDGCLREGSSTLGCGKVLGNVKADCIREGSSTPGCGKTLGNTKMGVIYEGSSTPGCGKALGNVKNGFVYAGSSTPGCGRKIGKVSDFTVVKCIEREKDETIVAMHHFLIKKIF